MTEKTIREAMCTRGVLASLNVSCWTANRLDKGLSDKQQSDARATAQGAIRVHKTLISDPIVKEPQRLAGAARRLHDELTLPWHYDGVGLLPATMIMTYDQRMGVLKAKFWEAVADVERNYGRMIQAAATELGSAFDLDDYPDMASLRNRYAWAVRMERLPTTGTEDLRLELPDEVVDLVREQLNTEHDMVVRAVIERMSKIVGQALDRMRARSEDPGARIVDSTFERLAELPELMRAMNITGNPDIARIIDDIEALHITADEVRKDDREREGAIADFASIQRRLKALAA